MSPVRHQNTILNHKAIELHTFLQALMGIGSLSVDLTG